jgi:hypothetical protein
MQRQEEAGKAATGVERKEGNVVAIES